ncbi:transmembrane 4 L6 family member 5 isoform X2 [Gouania willdenowi]|nr:transmembrane 4 L6 family member 5-like isoform X2 [Gouania willdenowi]XP_028320979.1 transmembrane 4 L6 family member 5-like isoform X2 [Gouania willdenowi]
MCVWRCLRCVGVSLIPMAIISMTANILLLFPELKIHFLLEGHVTREALWAPGLWGGALVLLGARSFILSRSKRSCCADRCQMLTQLLLSCVVLLGSTSCCVLSGTAVSRGPLCLYTTSVGRVWDVPLQPRPNQPSGYLFNRTLWTSVCEEPENIVQFNLVLFSVMGLSSALQSLVCVFNVLNTLWGMLLCEDTHTHTHTHTEREGMSSESGQYILISLHHSSSDY